MLSQRLIGALHAESIAFMPIVVRGEIAAALAFVNLSNSSPPVRSQLDFIGNLAASMSLALDNASLYQAERLAATSARTLAAINEILLSAVTPGDVLRRLVGEASAAAGADKCLVIAVDKERYTIAHVRNMNDDLVGQRHDALFFPTFARAAQERRPILIDDTEADSRTNKDFVRSHGLGALQLLPISIDDEVVAVLALAYDAPRAFGSEDMRFSERLAAAMSLAMRSARLYESEHRIAETLQEALLSLPERLAGIEYAHAYRSATESTRVGGDFYDVFEISPGRIGIVVGDISGKGLQAAVLTSRVKHSILAYAFDGDRGPAEILSLTNMAFYKTTAPEQFATVFFGILDVRQGCLIYSNAGHTTGAVTRVDGATTRLSSTGPVLGAIEQPAFGEESVHLDSDKLLLLYTDGITEARNGSELYGEDRLFRLLTEAKSADPTDLVGRIMLAVQQFSGGSRRDDIAVLAVRRLPD
jgi:serine phosphatase RsbU (regulator of sigma subunit)